MHDGGEEKTLTPTRAPALGLSVCERSELGVAHHRMPSLTVSDWRHCDATQVRTYRHVTASKRSASDDASLLAWKQ